MEYCFHAGNLRPEYNRKNGFLWDGDRIIVPNLQVLPIMTLHHSNPTGYFGIHKTYDLIARKYWFPRMRNRINHFVRTCNNCQRNKMERTPIRGLLEPLQISSQKWKSISIDWISGLPTSANKNDFVF